MPLKAFSRQPGDLIFKKALQITSFLRSEGIAMNADLLAA